ncbi:hypothetical protein M404DRAFT_598886 [Pisolithus tinctorius Marx 270]|uniref:Uncharacterized protein n=1 Tax=Pisolithus tinctorius Marx 270 TaxID=870435 RepID=A0A0C3NGK7_PISTI|nr:hypothetical protein M404DRAFT_374691 [Pisolithus tinctorius Marx 270]KIO04029.1 hypothetical protein M404DRAFT_598886 [Pisolithus tinctorius Marx 270]
MDPTFSSRIQMDPHRCEYRRSMRLHTVQSLGPRKPQRQPPRRTHQDWTSRDCERLTDRSYGRRYLSTWNPIYVPRRILEIGVPA